MRPRRPRPLTSEERKLWTLVARAVTPLRGNDLPPESEILDPAPSSAPDAKPSPAGSHRQPLAKTGPPPLAPLERKVLRALSRGVRRADAVLDLHGLRQAEAHDRLRAFLHRSQREGHSLVLVITGKGGPPSDSGGPFEERGVLRRQVPHWLRLPDMRAVVLGFDEAAAHHGGAGALYVRLRRRGPAG